MKLRDFLRINDITYREFASNVGTSIFTLNGIITGKRFPTMPLAMEIEKKTHKAVTLYDWFSEHAEKKDKRKKNSKPTQTKHHN